MRTLSVAFHISMQTVCEVAWLFGYENEKARINIHRHSRWFFSFGLLALILLAARKPRYDDLAVMQSLLATRKRAFSALNFFTFILAPLSLFFLLFCLLFYPCFFFSFLPYCYCHLSCSFCASAKPLLNPRTIRGFSYTKKRTAPSRRTSSFVYFRRKEPRGLRCLFVPSIFSRRTRWRTSSPCPILSRRTASSPHGGTAF